MTRNQEYHQIDTIALAVARQVQEQAIMAWLRRNRRTVVALPGGDTGYVDAYSQRTQRHIAVRRVGRC